ncbi:hypothetical protein ACMAY7_10255 [Rhodobacteraceae bacterium nBUS_24]
MIYQLALRAWLNELNSSHLRQDCESQLRPAPRAKGQRSDFKGGDVLLKDWCRIAAR